MLAGLEEKQVKGIITNQSVIDYYHIIDNGNQYNSILELSIPSFEYLAYNKENQELNVLINKLIRYYQIQHPDYKEKFGNTVQAYEEGIQKTHTSQARWKYSLILVLAVVFLMLGTAYGYYLFRKSQQQKELEHNISQLLQDKENDSSALQEDDRGDYTIQEGKDSISYEDQKIQQKFDYDPLTGLVNQRAYIERICNVVERNPEEMGAFAFINLDQFKIINDIWGHMVGDEILKVFAESVRQLVKNQDTIVFRISGDGFGAFRGNIQNEQQVEAFCEELEQLTAVIQVDGESIERSYSCGVSLYNKHTVEMKKLIEHAEEALKQCKLGTHKVVIWNEYI
jgi:diguanylate cyclase (GGDEF)-like protein